MKKIASALLCACTVIINVCIASPFGNKIAMNCLNDKSPLKMASSEILEWNKGGVTGDARSGNGAFHFRQVDSHGGNCFAMPSSNEVWIKIYRDGDTLHFKP